MISFGPVFLQLVFEAFSVVEHTAMPSSPYPVPVKHTAFAASSL